MICKFGNVPIIWFCVSSKSCQDLWNNTTEGNALKKFHCFVRFVLPGFQLSKPSFNKSEPKTTQKYSSGWISSILSICKTVQFFSSFITCWTAANLTSYGSLACELFGRSRPINMSTFLAYFNEASITALCQLWNGLNAQKNNTLSCFPISLSIYSSFSHFQWDTSCGVEPSKVWSLRIRPNQRNQAHLRGSSVSVVRDSLHHQYQTLAYSWVVYFW